MHRTALCNIIDNLKSVKRADTFRYQTITCSFCPECRETEEGREYRGKVSKTITGKQCQSWFSNTPHGPDPRFTSDHLFPDGSRKAAKNYCRNPDLSYTEGVWCYTMDPRERWAACYVPLCSKYVADQRGG